jgi:hypothetical protein
MKVSRLSGPAFGWVANLYTGWYDVSTRRMCKSDRKRSAMISGFYRGNPGEPRTTT